jgi:hypothetical protein
MVTPGGEEAFVSKILSESITLGQRCRHVPSFGITSHSLVREPFSQVVHIHAWKAIISDGTGDAAAHPLSTFERPAPTGFKLTHESPL